MVQYTAGSHSVFPPRRSRMQTWIFKIRLLRKETTLEGEMTLEKQTLLEQDTSLPPSSVGFWYFLYSPCRAKVPAQFIPLPTLPPFTSTLNSWGKFCSPCFLSPTSPEESLGRPQKPTRILLEGDPQALQ